MQNPRTIDSGSPDFAHAIAKAEDARKHAWLALELRQATTFYLGNKHGLTPDEARVRADDCRVNFSGHITREHDSLARLNGILVHAGGSAGDVFLVGRGLYRVCRPGFLAAYLGEQVPGLDEIISAFEPLSPDDGERSELAERASEYCEMVRFDP